MDSAHLEVKERAARVSELEWQVMNRDTTIKVLQADRERQGVSASLPTGVGGGTNGGHDDHRSTMLSPPASRLGGDSRWVWSGCSGWGHQWVWSGCCSGCGQDVVVGGDTSGCGLKAAVVTWIRMTHSRV